MNNFCHNDLVFSFSQIYQIIIIWNNQRNIFHHHSQNQAKEKRPFKTSLPLRQSNAHQSQQNAPVRLICARTGPILSQIYRPIKLMFKKSVQTPFKIKMQFNSIKLFARFVFLGWLFNFISNLLLFNQTDYVLLYTVFTHFVLPPYKYVTQKENKDGQDEGVTLFHLNGDTICTFIAGIDPTTKRGQYLYQPPFFDKIYRHGDQITFRLSFCDTIYRIRDEQTYYPAYVTDFGKLRLTAIENIQGKERKNKAWMTALEENAKALFIQTYKEGKSTQSGWLDGNREPDMPSEERQIVYLKSDKQTFALPVKAQGLTNDLDGGLPFWPDGQTDGYLYMIRPAKELKAKIKLTGSPKQKELKAFLDSRDEKQNVMIVVK